MLLNKKPGNPETQKPDDENADQHTSSTPWSGWTNFIEKTATIRLAVFDLALFFRCFILYFLHLIVNFTNPTLSE